MFFIFPNVFLVFFGFLWYVWFSRRFCWFSKNLRENQQNKKRNPYPRVGLKPLNTVCLIFPKVFWVFFGFLLYFWFSRRFFGFSKNLRENQQNKKTKPISKGGSETFKNFVLLVFPKVFLVFFGFLLYFWFPRRFFWFSKNLRET